MKVLAFLFMGMSLVLLLMGVNFQLQEKKKQVICYSRLHHWGTTFHMDYYQNGKCWRLSQNTCPEDWALQIQSQLYSSETSHCPAAPTHVGHSYRINHHVIPTLDGKTWPNHIPFRVVIMFDGLGKNRLVTVNEPPWLELEKRHLQGVNVLMLDGTVFYHQGKEGEPKLTWEFPE